MALPGVAISLHAAVEGPALRFLVEQYADRCDGALAMLRAKHANLLGSARTQQQEQVLQARCNGELAAAESAAQANIEALRTLLRMSVGKREQQQQQHQQPVVEAAVYPAAAGCSSSGLSLYDDAEQLLLHTARDWAAADEESTCRRHALVRTFLDVLPRQFFGAQGATAAPEGARQRRERRPCVLVLGSGLGRTSFELLLHSTI